MMKSKRAGSAKQLRGAVLIMVLTVMFVMIIMLLATLSVVSTAQNRYYVKFEENQAYYSSRTAIDIFRENLLSDNNYYAYTNSSMTTVKDYQYIDDMGALQSAKLTQGRALELDLYKITAQNDAGIASNILNSDDVFGSGTANPDNRRYSIEKTARPIASSNPEKDGEYFTYYNIKLPDVSDNGKNMGRFCDDGDALIKVEVISRRYDSGGLLDEFTDEQLKNATGGTIVNSKGETINIKDAIKNGNRAKDQMRIRITGTTTFMEVSGRAIVEYDVREGQKLQMENALTTTGGYSGGSGAQMSPAGGASTLDPGESVIGDGNGASGQIYSQGSVRFKSNSGMKFDKDTGMYVMGDITMENTGLISASGPNTVMFAGGTFTGKGQVGDMTNPMTIVCNEFQAWQNEFNMSGDIVANKFDCVNKSGQVLQNFSCTGSIYTNNLYTNVKIDHDAKLVKVGVPNNTNINLCVGGKITPANGLTQADIDTAVTAGYQYYFGQAENPDNPATNATVTFTADVLNLTSSYVTEAEDKIYRVVNVPSNVHQFKMPTAQSLFEEFYIDNSFNSEGDLINTAGNVDYSLINRQARAKAADDFLANENPLFAGGLDIYSASGPNLSGSLISSSGLLTTNGNITFDASAGDLYIQLQPNTDYSGVWTVTGSGMVNFIMPGGGYEFRFNNCRIESEAIKSNTSIINNGTTKAAKINYYCGTSSKIKTANNCFFAGYFYMPTAGFYIENGCNQTVAYTAGAGQPVVSVGNSAVVGSIICGEFTSSNKPGIIFLHPDSGNAEHGKTNFNWSLYQFRASV